MELICGQPTPAPPLPHHFLKNQIAINNNIMKYLKFWVKVRTLLFLWGILFPRFVHAQPGSPDPTFGGGDGYSLSSFLANGHATPNAVAVQSDGRIVVAGSTWIPNVTNSNQIAIARFMPNGNPDPTFSGDGKASLGLANMDIDAADLMILPDGKMLCIGSAWNSTENFFLLARLNTDGTLDHNFDGDGIVTLQIVSSFKGAGTVALQPDGKMVAAGYANLTGYEEFALIRIKPDGTLDNSFGGGDGIVTIPVGESYAGAEDVLIQPDGKIVAAGYAVANGYEDFALIRLNTNGILDQGFGGGDGIVIASFTNKNDVATSVALQSDGKIVLAGYAETIGGTADVEMAVVRFNPNGTPDNSFSGDGFAMIHVTENPDAARAIRIQQDGKMLLGGYSQQVEPGGEQYHFTMVRLTANGLPDPAFGSGDGIAILPISINGDFIYAMALQPDGKAVAAGPARIGEYKSFAVARFLTGVTVDTKSPEIFLSNISLFPNPVCEQATLQYELKTKERITVNLFDVQGKFIKNILPPTEKNAGNHLETLLFDSLTPAGHYFLSIESENAITVIEAIL